MYKNSVKVFTKKLNFTVMVNNIQVKIKQEFNRIMDLLQASVKIGCILAYRG